MTFEEIAAVATGTSSILGLFVYIYNGLKKIDIRDEYDNNKKEVEQRFEEGIERFRRIEENYNSLNLKLNSISSKIDENERTYNTLLNAITTLTNKVEQIRIDIEVLKASK